MPAEVYTVSQMRLYPLKSGGEFAIDEGIITPEGLESIDGLIKDHEYFAVRAKPDARGIHHFVTQRSHDVPDHPEARKENFRKLALVKPTVDERGQIWGWGSKDQQQVVVPEGYDASLVRPVRLWDYEGEAIEVPALTDWLRGNSGYDVRVMRTVGPWNRPVKQNYVKNPYKTRAQDGYPIHTILAADGRAVSAHAGVDIPLNRYRAQLVLEGGEAWSLHDVYEGVLEDDVYVVQTKPCGRCPMPGFDQELGVPSSLKPIAHVDAMRPRWIDSHGDENVIFGENWIVDRTSYVAIGSEFRPTSLRVAPNPVLQFAVTR